MLEKVKVLEKPVHHEPMHLHFPFSKGLGAEDTPLLEQNNLNLQRGSTKILQKVLVIVVKLFLKSLTFLFRYVQVYQPIIWIFILKQNYGKA